MDMATTSAAPAMAGSADDIVVPGIRLLAGDCRERLRDLPDASVDSIVTDPPYDLVSIVKRFQKSPRSQATENQANPYGRTGRGFMGHTWDGTGVAFDTATWLACIRVLKPGGHLIAFGGTRTYHRMVCAIEEAGFEIRDQIAWIFGSGFPKSHNQHDEWEGWGSALKPAMEPIVMARKPLIGTIAANLAAHRTGAINIDGCRINGEAVRTFERAAGDRDRGQYRTGTTVGPAQLVARGRWPANVIHDGSDEVVAAFPTAPGQLADAKLTGERKTGHIYGAMRYANGRDGEPSADSGNAGSVGFHMRPGARRHDAGSAARFFYCAKATKADREAGCESLPTRAAGQVGETSGQHITRRDEGYEVPQRANHHPTVKPTDLMRYLVRMVTPPGGTVLDPFTGSGSTGRAAILEGFEFVGCELTAEYLPIAEARIADAARLRAEEDAATAEAASPGPLFAGTAA